MPTLHDVRGSTYYFTRFRGPGNTRLIRSTRREGFTEAAEIADILETCSKLLRKKQSDREFERTLRHLYEKIKWTGTPATPQVTVHFPIHET